MGRNQWPKDPTSSQTIILIGQGTTTLKGNLGRGFLDARFRVIALWSGVERRSWLDHIEYAKGINYRNNLRNTNTAGGPLGTYVSDLVCWWAGGTGFGRYWPPKWAGGRWSRFVIGCLGGFFCGSVFGMLGFALVVSGAPSVQGHHYGRSRRLHSFRASSDCAVGLPLWYPPGFGWRRHGRSKILRGGWVTALSIGVGP